MSGDLKINSDRHHLDSTHASRFWSSCGNALKARLDIVVSEFLRGGRSMHL